MLDALKFVARGISRSDLNPGSAYFRIQNGRVTASNGVLSLSAPLSLSFDAAPEATRFVAAINACEGTISITQESKSRLVVRSGNFKATVPCVDISTISKVEPEGESVPATEVVAALTKLHNFICQDESKTNLCGILLTGQSAYATNNLVVVQYWLGTMFPVIANVPVDVVDEVIRIKTEPTTVQVSKGSITFHYANQSWIRSQLNAQEWPNVAGVMNAAWQEAAPKPLEPSLKEACLKLAECKTKKIFFRGKDVATAREDGEDGIATVATKAPETGCYWTKFLTPVLEVAEQIDFGRYPKPVPFLGEKIRGLVVGVVE